MGELLQTGHRKLSDRVRQGDRAALEELVKEAGPALRKHCFRLTGSAELAEELFQETFLKAIQHCETFPGETHVRPWLLTIARNLRIDWFRSRESKVERRSARDMETALAKIEAPQGDSEAAQAFAELLAPLPQEDRAILLLQNCTGHTLQEIAEVLGISPAAVKSRAHRARERLREHLSS